MFIQFAFSYHCSYKVRQWTEIVPDAVTFKNAYRVRKLDDEDLEKEQTPVPHSFIFTKRSSYFSFA